MITEVLRDRVIDLKNRVSVPEFGAHEVECRQYLETLSPSDLANVRRVVEVIAKLNRKYQDAGYPNFFRYGVIAVGSTVRPEAQRNQPPGDIDLRVISGVFTLACLARHDFIKAAVDVLTDEAESLGIKYEVSSETERHYQVKTTRGDSVQWVDYNNQDPSFVFAFSKGLPIHVSISGVDRPDLDTHLREERKRGGCFSILLNGEAESRHLYWEPARALKNRINRRITPRVKEAVGGGFSGIKDGLSEQDLLQVYQGLVENLSAFAYGERAFTDGTTKIIDWDVPPQIEIREYRYLTVLSNLGESLRQGEPDRTRRIIKGLTASYGSRGDSGGPPCNPEVLSTIHMIVTGIACLVEAGKLGEAGKTLRYDWDYQIIQIVNGFSCGDRELISDSLFQFLELTNQFIDKKKIKQCNRGALTLPSLY